MASNGCALPFTHGTGGWVSSIAGLEVLEEKNFLLLPGIET
jgi:hypothetical protein